MQIKEKNYGSVSLRYIGGFLLFLISLLSRKTHEMAYSYHLVLIKMGCCGIF